MVDIILPRAMGADGVTPVFTIGDVTAGPLAVTITGTTVAPVLNFSIPAGSSPPFAISDTTGLQTALDGKQPLDSDLTSIAALTTTAYGRAFLTYADASAAKTAINLGNVDNTSDANKPVSTATQTALNLKANIASPTFTGTVTLPAGQVVNGVTLTNSAGTTVYLRGDGTYATPSGGGGGSGDVVGPASATDNAVALYNGTTGKLLKDGPLLSTYALLASPTFTGTPAAPTAAPGTNTTQVATTAFVAALGALKADLASPTFTGIPAAPTAAAATSTTQIATTAFVTTADNLKANLASPTFTGTPAAPTATTGTNTTQLATTAFVQQENALKANISDTLNQQTGTTYTLVSGDNGKVVELSNASAITLTAPVLTSGFNCIIRQTGAGQVTVTTSSTTLRNRQGYSKLSGQWAEASIGYRATNEFVLSGDVSA